MNKVVALPVFEKNKVEVLIEILDAFKIKCKSVSLEEDEFIDRYDVVLTPGVRSSKVDKALLDIGLALRAQTAPRGYPVLKEGVYRIEVQKKELKTDTFSNLYVKEQGMYAPMTLGLDAYGELFLKDLHLLPNLLIGGIPGSGKSVLLHAIILSLLGSNSKLYLVDPKMVEFGIYDKKAIAIRNTVAETHLLISEVTDLMEERFKKLSKAKCRNIHEFNSSVKSNKRLNPVVIVIDEWADIVLHDKSIQKPLCVVAQKGRAAGISIILATQRPSATVITGLIKANFSGRIALRVASKIDSRIILDQIGAETISDIAVGLYTDHRENEPRLFRAPYIKNPEKELLSLLGPEPKSFWQRFWQ